MSATSISLTPEGFTYDDLIELTAWMAAEGFTAAEVAYAVEKPWKHTDWLAIARRGGSAEELDDGPARQESRNRWARGTGQRQRNES
jgi:hypothetical protein